MRPGGVVVVLTIQFQVALETIASSVATEMTYSMEMKIKTSCMAKVGPIVCMEMQGTISYEAEMEMIS